MVATDFEYDGEYLKDWGYMICRTDASNGFETVVADSQLDFSNVNLMHGKLFELTTAQYENRVEISFQIGKFLCKTGVFQPISAYEQSTIKRWLNRPTFNRFKLIQPDWADIYMEGSFNVKNIELNGIVYFLELTFISNRPFSLHEPITYKTNTTEENNSFAFIDMSDELGYIYPELKITCLSSGNLEIHNSNEDRITIIENCQENEEITFTPELVISSSIAEHKIQDDFNYTFLRISNSYNNRKNILTFSLPVKIELTYSPIIKVVS